MGNNCGCNFEGEGGELAFDKDVVSVSILASTETEIKFRFTIIINR